MYPQPLVSIIIPTKNRRELLRETLASVMAQTYSSWEAVVVDDGSTDGTEELVQFIAAKDERVRFVRREQNPRGASACRNIGISEARGEYLIFLDSDDLLAPTCLNHRVSVLQQNPDADFAVFLTHMFHSTPGDSPYLWNKYTDEHDLDRFLRHDQPWHTSGPLWRKACMARIGFWDNQAFSAQDWEFHIRAIAAGLRYVKVEAADSYWRDSKPGSISSSWSKRRQVCNRIRLFMRIADFLRSHAAMTERRRRILAGEFYHHVFHFGLRNRSILMYWNSGRRSGLVRNIEFITLLCSEFIVRQASRFGRVCDRLFFPEKRIPRTHRVARPSNTQTSQGQLESRKELGVFQNSLSK